MRDEKDFLALQIQNSSDPQPSNLEVFIPWACKALQIQVPAIRKTHKVDNVATNGKSKRKPKPKQNLPQAQDKLSSDYSTRKSSSWQTQYEVEGMIRMTTVYDENEKLIEIIFLDKTPQELLKLISLVTDYHPSLYSITVKFPDKNSIYEISKLLNTSNITDLCLDNHFIKEANYYIFLETANNLRYLSLSRCKLNDDAVKEIMSRLVNPLPASKTLAILTLSSNNITNIGASYIANTLKTNRSIIYLNLADNMINDHGAAEILTPLVEFPIKREDLDEVRGRKMQYLKNKIEMIEQTIQDQQNIVREIKESTPTKKRKQDETIFIENSDRDILLKQVTQIVETKLGIFYDPYDEDTISKGNSTYCKGNNVLSYLNMSYNNLSFVSVKKLLSVLVYQRSMNRKPQGLFNICLEGNSIPETCKEMKNIDALLELNVMNNIVVLKRKGLKHKK